MPALARSHRFLVAQLAVLPLLLLGLTAAPAGAAPEADAAPAAQTSGQTSSQTSSRTTTARATAATKVRRALRIANGQVGDPYRYGAAGPNAFDCSGLIYFATHRAGLRAVPRTSSAQAGHARRIKRSAMRPGDLVFFTSGGRVYHVGMFIGRRDGRVRIVHSPNSGSRVHRAPVWTNSWFPGTLRRR